MKRLNRLMFII